MLLWRIKPGIYHLRDREGNAIENKLAQSTLRTKVNFLALFEKLGIIQKKEKMCRFIFQFKFSSYFWALLKDSVQRDCLQKCLKVKIKFTFNRKWMQVYAGPWGKDAMRVLCDTLPAEMWTGIYTVWTRSQGQTSCGHHQSTS